MKAWISTLAATLFGVVMLMASPSARATGPTDCTNGCEIVTCTATYCTVWHCDSGGCLIVGGYNRRMPHTQLAPGPANRPQAFNSVCDVTHKQSCAIKTCANGACAISVFDGKGFVAVGRVEDVDSLVEKANAQLRK